MVSRQKGQGRVQKKKLGEKIVLLNPLKKKGFLRRILWQGNIIQNKPKTTIENFA